MHVHVLESEYLLLSKLIISILEIDYKVNIWIKNIKNTASRPVPQCAFYLAS
jgi:hypothetical protein